jgi:hypothetical protein
MLLVWLQNMVGIYLQEFPNGKRTNGVGKDPRMLDQAEKVSLWELQQHSSLRNAREKVQTLLPQSPSHSFPAFVCLW